MDLNEKQKDKDIKYINIATKSGIIYFFIDDSGTILNKKLVKKVQSMINSKSKIENNLKAFAVTAIGMNKNQIKKGYRLSKSLKINLNININATFHRNEMRFDRQRNYFKNTKNEELWTIFKNLDDFIIKEGIISTSAGLNNFAEIYMGKQYDDNIIFRKIYYSLIKSINEIMEKKYPNFKAIIIFEGEIGNDYKRKKITLELKKEFNFNYIRSVRFMRKKNKKGQPNFGIELVDYINGSNFSYFSLQDFHIHLKNNISYDEINNNIGIKYAN